MKEPLQRGTYSFTPFSVNVPIKPLVTDEKRKAIIEALRQLEALKKKLKDLLDT